MASTLHSTFELRGAKLKLLNCKKTEIASTAKNVRKSEFRLRFHRDSRNFRRRLFGQHNARSNHRRGGVVTAVSAGIGWVLPLSPPLPVKFLQPEYQWFRNEIKCLPKHNAKMKYIHISCGNGGHEEVNATLQFYFCHFTLSLNIFHFLFYNFTN